MDRQISFLLSVLLIIEVASVLGGAPKKKHIKHKKQHHVRYPNLKKKVNKIGGQDNMIPIMSGSTLDGEASTDTFITWGDDAPRQGRPYMATLQYLLDEGATQSYTASDACNTTTVHGARWFHTCGGALIAGDTVLTAAHCVDWYDEKEDMWDTHFRVGLGWWDLSEGENNIGSQIRGIKNITIHPDYDSTWTVVGESVDIAIITLDRPADIVPGVVEIIKLQRRKYKNENGSCDMAGWGMTECGQRATLQYTNTTVITHNECNVMWRLAGWGVGKKEMCSLNWDTDDHATICSGDSGSVLVCGGEAAGVASWGESKCLGCLPAVYARISYRSTHHWIQRTIRQIRRNYRNTVHIVLN